MNDIPTGFVTATHRLTLQDVDANSQTALRQLTEQGYEIHTGLTTDFADQIKTMSQEPAIREYCPKDATDRFADSQTAKKWLSKGRAMFLLLKDGQLIGYGWTGHATSDSVPGGQTTFALRIGQIGHGQGLAAPFSWLTISASNVRYGLKDIWLETWASNGAAVHIYHKLGFVNVTERRSTRPTAVGDTVDDVRIYMKLPDNYLVN
jgi:hypothetical protein